ncbi:hypothetical protein V757_02265 [Pelistega indica]|uniref:Helicase ATP-binding domain-containing protein n=1 Tax=Pelistega indica TaxID=1414851 RepID=V8G8C6_9BURK|nr:DEAD/DEAH box helicase [Pelistega indica]ETD72784.1 hypothetical protein V757_02265 [Pelistega indica]
MAAVDTATQTVTIKSRDPSKIKAVFPEYEVGFTNTGAEVIRVPHTIESIRVLANLGVKTKNLSPINYYYGFPKIKGVYAPMKHQIETARFLSENPRAFCLNQPRTGKTASVIMALDFLKQQGIAKSILVVAPRSCLRDVWETEIFGLVPSMSVAVLHGTKQQRLKLLAQNYDVFIINPDGIKVISAELQKAVEQGRINVVVFDEVTDFANPQSERWKCANRVTKTAKYVWGLTGTPGGPEGVYGMVKLILPHNMDCSFSSWRDRTMVQVNTHKWVTRTSYLESIFAVMQPNICFKKDDIMDLPPLQQFDRMGQLSKEQESLYTSVRKFMRSDMANITAQSAAVATSKLMQIATGAVKTDEDKVQYLDIAPRMEVLLDIIKEAEYKVLVFAPFTGVIDLLEREISKHYSCAVVDGRTAGHKRDAIFNSFRLQKDPHVLIAHPKTMSFGLELASADTIVFWGAPLNGTFVYQQAIERINSKLQKSKTPAVVHLYSTPIESKLFTALKAGIDINTAVLDIFKEVISE